MLFNMELEIPQISMITDFEAGVNCIQNPSLISRFFSLSSVTIVCSFWQWGAIILAILATFSSILKRIKVIHIRRLKSSSESLLHHLDIDLDLTDDDSDDSSGVSSDNDDDEPTSTASFSDECDDFVVKGSSFIYNSLVQNGNLRLRCNRRGEFGEGFGWPDFSSGKNVVKLWDSLGLSIGFDSFDDSSDSESVVSLWDLDQEKKINDIFGCSTHLPAVSAATPSRSVVMSAEMNHGRNGVVLGGYDTRIGGKKPAIYAEWGSPASAAARKVVGVKQGGVEKVYVRDDASGIVTVGDVRRVKTPLETVSETDGDMWCDADAVIADDEFVDCSK
ncbi:OLC1v1032268C1 [Oldenlandia corymbosa var. corymbosa]|uniref:OLC1v1032268C1 n=1 Tax=Oldenlandia corymbosa var. corymbosa TaxID=529605 RepID=A0AAV1CM20_OLDCO|nr:OLC1v1032268C1 [Oldenlandia corymbosa var. corymbosa]